MASFEKYTQQRKKKEYKGSKSFYGYTMEKTKKASDDIAPVRKDKNTTDLSDEKEEESYFRKKAKNSDSDSWDGGAPYYNPAAKYDKMYGSGAISWDEQAPIPEKETEKQPMGTFEKISAFYKGVKDLMTPEKKNNDGTWFKGSSYFDDGYDFGDVSKTILGSVGDLLEDAATGIIGFGEKALDSFVSVAPYLAQNAYEPSDLNNNQQAIQMHNQAAEASKAPASDFVQKDLYDEEKVAKAIISNPIRDLTGFDIEGASIFGEKTDALAQSGGQMLLTAGLQTVGVPWWLTTGVSAFGGQAETALKEGAELDEAILSATVSTGAEILTEKLFGGSGLGEKGLINIEGLTKGITNKVIKTLVDYGVDITAEGFEEVFTEFINNLGTALYKEEKLTDILFSEEALQGYIDSYIGGMALSGFMNSPKAYKSVKSGTDYRLDLSQNEQKVFDKEYENRLAEETEAKGEALTRKEEVRIYDSVVRDIEKGYIATDTIESVLGGETYKAYKDSVDSEKALQDEFDALNKMKAGEMTGEQTDRRAELKQQLQGLKNNSNNSKLQERLSSEVMELVKDSKLSESYNEKLRRAQKFEADLTKYNGKQLETVKRAVQSGVLNNTNRTHDFVDMIAKISADKGVSFDFTSNQKLKESGFAVEGRTVNGFVKGGKVSLNINSAKALNSVVGHEITHVLEGTELYDVLKESITEYAKSKGEYQKRLAELSKLYEGVENADVEAELIADLVGDYLFTDSDFVSRLLEENPSLFKKIFNEIKYLCKVATAGSKEAKQLEKVKRTFEKAYRETKAEKNTAEGGVIKYSLMNDVAFEDNVKSIVNMTDEVALQNKEQGNFVRVMDSTPSVILENVKDAGDYEVIIRFDALYLASRKDGVLEGHYHNLGEDIIAKLPQFIENPDAIVRMNNGRLNLFSIMETPKGKNGIISMEMNTVKDINSKNDKYNLVISVFSAKDNYTKNNLTKNGVKVEYKKEDLSQVNPQLYEWLATINDESSANSISDSSENVKQNGNLSLSADNPTPQKYGNYNVYGDDVRYQPDDIAPVRKDAKPVEKPKTVTDDIAPVREDLQAAKPETMTEDIAPVREDIKKPVQDSKRKYISFEDFANNDSSVWKNVAYDDQLTKNSIMKETHNAMVNENAIVKVSDNVRERVTEAYPDLRSMKKKERTPILKEAMDKLKSNIREFLGGLKNQSFEFEVNGKILDAKLYSTGINEVLEKITKEKATMLYSTEDIFRNARYLYSTPDYAGDTNVYRWNYFYTPVKIGDDIVGVRIAVRDLIKQGESQIYNWGIKKDTSLDGVRDDSLNRKPHDVSSDASINIIPEESQNVNRENKPTKRSELHHSIVENIKTKFTEKGFDFDKVLENAKNMATIRINDNTPQRVMKKTFGPEEGDILADETVNKVAQNETEGIKWLNSYLDRKNGVLVQISKQYGIKPGSKESAAAQKYAEGFYVDKKSPKKPIYKYDDAKLAQEFPDIKTQSRIKGLARDPRIRQIYDETLDAINEARKRNLYPEIPKRDNYFLHFRAMEDTFSLLGLPFNPNDIRAKDLPTNINGITADLKPGQPYFPSAQERKGIRTSFDLLGGLERYLTSAKNQIYHIDDIQTLRALRNYIADSFGRAEGLESLDNMTDEEAEHRITQVYKSHLSNFAKFLNEEANVIAGKTVLIDRGIEGLLGRRAITFLDDLNKQVGSNLVGYNISSPLTNVIPVVQTFAETNKFDFLKAFAQTASNKVNTLLKKDGDGFTEKSPVIIRRKGAEQFYRKPYQKIADVGYVLMSAVDNISTELIARTKFNEFTRKGMNEQQAHFETDKWVSGLMGDRSLGQLPMLYNSKLLNMVVKFQLEVRIQLDSQFYDTIQEAKLSNKDIENGLLRNAKTAAKVTSTFFQLAVAQHLFGKAFEAVAGYNPAFDIIEAIIKACGFDDDEEDEDTVLDNIEEALFALAEDMPYANLFVGGGRIPVSSALPIGELWRGEDQYGNEKPRGEILKEAVPYYILPGGYGQIKKTVNGLKMFDDDFPVAGSYTDSGNLRFPIEDTPANRIHAAIFGQYASKNAREYFDEGYAPLKEKQIEEYKELDVPIADYWKYREGLSGLKTLNEKGDYIGGLDLSVEKKNLLINNIAGRETPIDMTDYHKYSDFEEFDFATRYPEKYKVLQEQGLSVKEYKEKYEESVFMYTDDFSWAANNPEQYAVSKAVSDDVTEYKKYTADLYNIKADKDKNGKSISGSRKKKVVDYINGLNIDYGAKIILFKKEYSSDDTYNKEILEYLNGRSDITYAEKVTILTELGFDVDSDGRVTW